MLGGARSRRQLAALADRVRRAVDDEARVFNMTHDAAMEAARDKGELVRRLEAFEPQRCAAREAVRAALWDFFCAWDLATPAALSEALDRPRRTRR